MRYAIAPIAGAFAIGLALGLYLYDPEVRPLFAILSASVGLLAGMSLEPIKHHFWLSQERWKSRFETYSDLVAALWERETKLTRAMEFVPMEANMFARLYESIQAADDRARAAAARAQVLGDDIQPVLMEYEQAMAPHQERTREFVARLQAEKRDLDPALAGAVAKRESLLEALKQARVRVADERAPEALQHAQQLAGEYEQAAREHEALVARLAALNDQLRPEMMRMSEANIAATRRLRAAILPRAQRALR